jgi:cytochrome c oxidase subunit 4
MSHSTANTLEPTHAAHGHESTHHGPKNPVRVYALTLTTLLILTVITVVVAQFDLGEANVFVAMLIATAKATVVALFFMHLLHDKPMNSIILCTALVMLGLLLSFCFMDSSTRLNLVPRGGQAAAGSDFNRPSNLATPFNGEKKEATPPAKPAPIEAPR